MHQLRFSVLSGLATVSVVSLQTFKLSAHSFYSQALDLLVIRYCWTRWGQLSPGQMTDLKGAMVGNEALAAIAIE